MDGIGGCEEDSFYIVSLQDIVKAFLLVTSVFPAESRPFFDISGVAGHHPGLLASLDRIGDDPRPTPDPDEGNPHLIPWAHDSFLLLKGDFSDLRSDRIGSIFILFAGGSLSNYLSLFSASIGWKGYRNIPRPGGASRP
jgi:hypothetical protein